MARPSQSRLVVYAALSGNLLIALSKFIAAALSGSSAMWSEGVHSTVDTVNEVLLLHGMNRAAMPPDRAHPFGHGRDLSPARHYGFFEHDEAFSQSVSEFCARLLLEESVVSSSEPRQLRA